MKMAILTLSLAVMYLLFVLIGFYTDITFLSQETMMSFDHFTATRRRFLLAGGAAAAMQALTGVTHAQSPFPSTTVSMIVPYTAGGASDIGARMLTPEMGRLLGQPVVVDNASGAGGALGVQKLIRATPDGHTVLYGSLSEALLVPLINPRVGYRVDDLLPVAFVGGTPAVFVARPDFPANTLDEFIAMAKRNPGKLSYGSPGVGTFQHVIGEAFKTNVSVFMLHIPYRGGAQILNDVMSGQIDIGITSAANAAGFVRSGRLKAIGVTAAQRLSVIPDAQSFGEISALKGLELSTWGVIYAPAATPASVVSRLNAAVNQASMSPSAVQMRARLGVELNATMSPAEVSAFISTELAKYRPLVRDIKLD
jgi:tripartite-type tricarboxylate transporter receptor subunit TctC